MQELKFSITNKINLRDVPYNAKILHITRPIKFTDFRSIVKKCKELEKILMPKSTWKRLGEKTKKLIEERKIEVGILDYTIKGRPISINLEKILAAIELYKEYKSFRKIADELNIPKSTAHYLIKYAKRKKFKKDSVVVVLG